MPITRRVTLREIAKSAGVSPATVSLVIRASPLVAAETQRRVQSVIDELGYVYHRAAANLRARSTHTVGLLVCEITNPFYAELTAGMDATLDESGIVAFLANTAESPLRQDRFIERMREQRVDGLLLCPAEGTAPDLLRSLRASELPCVQVLRRVDEEGDYVSADYRRGMILAVDHVVRLGHRRIAYVGGGRRTSAAEDRAAGYREAMTRHGLPIGPVLDCLPTREAGTAAVGMLLRSAATDPTAILCYNDICAFGVMLGLSDRGLVPGSDCAVVGFDDIAEAAYSRPALTTIGIPPRQIGIEAARLLLRRIGDPQGGPERIVLAPQLVVRDSCGAPPDHRDRHQHHHQGPARAVRTRAGATEEERQ